MCYDISFHTKLELITKYLPEIQFLTNQPLTFDSIFHVQGHSHLSQPVVIFEDGVTKLVNFEWGVIAGYMNTPEKIAELRSGMLNARSEKILDTKSIWSKIRRKRCLIPVSGFFEHRKVSGFKNKIPYHITVKDEGIVFMAGLYNYAPLPKVDTGEVVGTFAIVTRAADKNEMMRQIHNDGPNKWRMPLILDYHMIRDWLNPDLADSDLLAMLEFEMPHDRMDAWPVRQIRRVSYANDECVVKREEYEGLPGIYEPPVRKLAGTLF